MIALKIPDLNCPHFEKHYRDTPANNCNETLYRSNLANDASP